MLWIDTKTDADAVARSERIWGMVYKETPDGFTGSVPGPEKENGEFWGDAIQDLKDDPRARLEMARRQLPLPGAFREMAVALRALIKEARKEGQPFEPLLRELHHFIAISSWYEPYNPIAREPGFNVLERTSYGKLAALDLSWERIGCNELLGLNKTDRKLMIETWGEPAQHTTANALYRNLWLEGCQARATERQRRMDLLVDDIRDIMGKPAPKPKPQSLLTRLFGRKA
jgi:hypothetical protein